MKGKLKSPIYRDGILFCSYCRSPLLTIKETYFRFKCAVCQRPLGKLTMATLKRMFDDFPKELAKEWTLEMEARKKLSHGKF
ncbi:MAG: hypothetical protein QXZ51_06310 [Candidatus Bathyarchaeia archaeon]